MSAAFVYQRKRANPNNPRKNADICEIKCKARSHDIQACYATLTINKRTGAYDTSKCQYAMDRFTACCEKAKEAERLEKEATSNSSLTEVDRRDKEDKGGS